MNRRTARKILRDPMRHNAHQILQAARRARPWWFVPAAEHPSSMERKAKSMVGWDPECPGDLRKQRRDYVRRQGLHNWAWLQAVADDPT